MISTTSILACVVTLLLSLVLPVLVLIVYAVKNKNQGIVSAWFLGAAGFFVPQILIRLPILNALGETTWFFDFAQNHIFLYCVSLAFTAGLFELAGRFVVAKILNRKNLTYKRSLAAGLGHGGIEAMLIIGMTYVNNLVIMLMVNSGSFDVLLSQTAAQGGDVSQLQAAYAAITAATPGIFLLAGYERLLTMTAQAAMSMIVCWGVHRKQAGMAALLCLLMHTLLDSTAVISVLATDAGGNRLTQTAAYAIVYFVLTLAAALSVWILLKIRRSWLAEERKVSYDPEK